MATPSRGDSSEALERARGAPPFVVDPELGPFFAGVPVTPSAMWIASRSAAARLREEEMAMMPTPTLFAPVREAP